MRADRPWPPVGGAREEIARGAIRAAPWPPVGGACPSPGAPTAGERPSPADQPATAPHRPGRSGRYNWFPYPTRNERTRNDMDEKERSRALSKVYGILVELARRADEETGVQDG